MHLNTNNFCKELSLSSQGFGRGCFCGSPESKITFQSFWFFVKWFIIPLKFVIPVDEKLTNPKRTNWSETYLKASKSLRRHNSSHDLVTNQSEGFTLGLSNPTPPVKRNIHSDESISSLLFIKLITSKSEKSSLSFSNKLRHIFAYKWYVKTCNNNVSAKP